jgi:hypothetical protein
MIVKCSPASASEVLQAHGIICQPPLRVPLESRRTYRIAAALITLCIAPVDQIRGRRRYWSLRKILYAIKVCSYRNPGGTVGKSLVSTGGSCRPAFIRSKGWNPASSAGEFGRN